MFAACTDHCALIHIQPSTTLKRAYEWVCAVAVAAVAAAFKTGKMFCICLAVSSLYDKRDQFFNVGATNACTVRYVWFREYTCNAVFSLSSLFFPLFSLVLAVYVCYSVYFFFFSVFQLQRLPLAMIYIPNYYQSV